MKNYEHTRDSNAINNPATSAATLRKKFGTSSTSYSH